MTCETAHKILSVHQSWRSGLVDALEYTAAEVNKALQLAITALQSDPYAPDWSQAPELANYYAIEADGQCIWFENEPQKVNLSYEEYFGSWSKNKDPKNMKLFKRPDL